MKKTYINPEMEIVNVEVQQMLAASLGISSTEVDGSQALGRDADFSFDDSEDW